MKKQVAFLIVYFYSVVVSAFETELLTFGFEGETLSGVYAAPEETAPKGIVLIVHGYGETNAVAGNWYADVRSAIHKAGYATYMWDKMGCGDSTGRFDINQPVANSADEAIAAIRMLQGRGKPGAGTIGLWGVSRAGWINPLIIEKQGDIAFWISVSGVDAKENFGYLLEQNSIIDGKTPIQAKLIKGEWIEGGRIANRGGGYSEYRKATRNLAEAPMWLRFTDGGVGWFRYFFYRYEYQQLNIDEETGLPVVVEDFDTILANMDLPVLALFGELDMNVDWRQTKKLYEGVFNQEQLKVASFPNCNHNMFVAKTGGFNEFQDNKLPWKRCDGYIETIYQWLANLK